MSSGADGTVVVPGLLDRVPLVSQNARTPLSFVVGV